MNKKTQNSFKTRSRMSEKDSLVKKRLAGTIRRRNKSISDDEMPGVLNSIKRFAKVAQKLATEPQAQILYKEKKTKGKTRKTRLIKTDITELVKIKPKPSYPIGQAMREFLERFSNEKKR